MCVKEEEEEKNNQRKCVIPYGWIEQFFKHSKYKSANLSTIDRIMDIGIDEDDEVTDIREQIFHNTVREQIVSVPLFI